MTPEEKIIDELSSENGKLRTRVEVLEYRIANLLGREDGAERLGMTFTEFRLAHLLANAAPRVVTRDALLEARRPDTQFISDGVHIKIVDVLICKIRKRLEAHDLKINTAWGAGYWMTEEDADRFYELIHCQQANTNQKDMAA